MMTRANHAGNDKVMTSLDGLPQVSLGLKPNAGLLTAVMCIYGSLQMHANACEWHVSTVQLEALVQ